jgi:hypothetical protein
MHGTPGEYDLLLLPPYRLDRDRDRFADDHGATVLSELLEDKRYSVAGSDRRR